MMSIFLMAIVAIVLVVFGALDRATPHEAAVGDQLANSEDENCQSAADQQSQDVNV